MRRSAYVAAPLLASAAVALLSGCRTTEMERCVDERNQVVDPSFCQTIAPGSDRITFGPRPGGHIYRYYYGGGGSFAAGSSAFGGSYYPSAGRSYAPSSGHSFTTSTGTSRGGFGSSFSSGHAGGAGE